MMTRYSIIIMSVIALLSAGVGNLAVWVYQLEGKLCSVESQRDQARELITRREAADRRLGIIDLSELGSVESGKGNETLLRCDHD